MADNPFAQFHPAPQGSEASNPFAQFHEKPTDGALARGWNKAKQSMAITGQLAAGDAAGAAQTIRQADDYARANPGMPEARELGQAWDRGDGVTGGIKEVAGEFAKDWKEAPGLVGGLRATGRNLRAMGEGLLEQVPNMLAPTAGLVAGGAAGAAAGSAIPVLGNVAGAALGAWGGSTLGNTLVEGGGMAQEALHKAGIDPQDTAAVERFLKEKGDTLLGQSAQKGAIIGAVDALTAGVGGKILNAPARAAANRALGEMGVDAADKAAVKAAMNTPEFAARIAGDEAFKASQKGAGNIARNVGVAALEPAGEFTGEFVGQGVATGDWDTKNAALEAFSSLGQSGAMFAGQKAYQAATRPASKRAMAQADAQARLNAEGAAASAEALAEEARNKQPLMLGNEPPGRLFVFPDGTVGRAGEVESYLANLPEEQRADARARLMGQSYTEVNDPQAQQARRWWENYGDGAQPAQRPDYLAEVQQAVRSGTPYSTQQTVDTVRNAMEDAWLAQNVGAEAAAPGAPAQAADTVGAQLQTQFEQAGGDAAVAAVDARVRTGRILSGLQNLLDAGAQNTVQVLTGLNESLGRINEQPLDAEETGRVRRMVDAYMGFRGVGEPAALPAESGAPAVDRFADNSALEALIPERPAAPPSVRMGLNPAAGPLSRGAAMAVDAGVAAAPAHPATGPGPLEAAGSVIPPSNGVDLAPQADQAQQTGAKPSQTAGAPRAPAAGAAAAQELSHGTAPTANNGNQGNQAQAPQAQAQAATESVAIRPGNWRTSMLRAGPVAKGLGIDPRGKRLAQVLAEIDAADAARAGQQQAGGADLSAGQIDREWSAFAPETGTLGIPRAQMPQIKAAHRGALVNFLQARGIDSKAAEVPPNDLKPTQAEFSPAKVEQARQHQGGDRSILVSSDGYVVDGHHQWLAKRANGEPVKVIRLDAPIREVLAQVAEFPSTQTASGAINFQEGNANAGNTPAPDLRAGEERAPGAGPAAADGRGQPAGRPADAQPDGGRPGRREPAAGAPGAAVPEAVPAGGGAGQSAAGLGQAPGREALGDIGLQMSREMPAELAQALQALRPPRAAATVGSVRAAVRQLVSGGALLPNRLGRVVVATSDEIRAQWEPLIGPVAMGSEAEGKAQGFYDPQTKTVFLIADHIQAGDELGVVAHELMHKHGPAVLGEEGWARLHGAIEAWASAEPGSMERRVYDEAAARVRESRPAGVQEQGYSSQELFPYAVQVALELGVRPNALAPKGTVAHWLGQVKAMLRQVWQKIAGGKADFNSLDLVNLALGIAQRENPEHAGELDGAIAGVEREIRAVIDAARSPGHAPQKAVLGQVADWLVQGAAANGLNIEGFRHVLDGSAVRHMIKNHYEAKGEKSRGQIPLTDADLMALPEVLQNPERVVLGTKNRLGKEQIAYIKQLPDGSTLYLEEVRTGRKELAAVTARKYPATMNVESIVSTLHPNAQSDGGNGVIVLRSPALGNSTGDTGNLLRPSVSAVDAVASERSSATTSGDGATVPGQDPHGNKLSQGPMFSRAAASPAGADYTAAQQRAAERVFGVQAKETLADRAKAMRHNLGTKLRQGLVDQFAPIKEVSERAYILARLSKGSDGAVEAALLYGKPFLRDGVADVDVKDGGFAKVLASLKGEDTRFFQWVAAQRAERLKAEGKENLLTDQDITALKSLNAGRFADGTPRMPVYAEALRELNAFNEASLKVAMESGLIDQAAYDLMKDQPYVPFYRLMEEDGGMRGPRFSSGLVNQQAWKKLKGGTQQLNADLLQNTLMNWSHLYAAAARNRASLETMAAAERLGIAYKVTADTKGSVKVMRDGVAEHWAVEDPYLLDAISAMSYAPGGIVKAMAPFKRLLTFGVTVNPTFKIRNLIRDSLSAIAQSDLSYNPAANVARGWKATAKDSQTYASMLASGGIIKFGTQEDTNRVRAQIERLGGEMLDKSGFDKLKGQMKSLWEAYEEFGDRTENVNRAALYERLIAKGHSHAEAAFMARDLMDFSMSGKWETVRFLAQTVPFLNARLQGLYKLGRAAKEDPRRFAAMAGAVSLASLGLLAAYSDDEDWKKREDWDRDNFWWFKVGDKAFRIPKPFEVGSIGTVAERTAELMFSDEMTGKRFGQRISDMVFNTFAMDPTPQLIKPFIDVYANKDSFSGRPIEGMADERLRPQDRYNERTSEVARLLGSWGLPDPVRLAKGEYSGLSPKQIDFLLRGYFGWLATVTTTATDTVARPLLDRGERPAARLRDTFLAGNFVEDLPTGSSRYVTTMYEQAKDVEQAWASYQAAVKSGDIELARSIQEEEGPKLRNRFAVANAKQQIAEIGQQAKKIEGNRLLSAEAKRERLDELDARKHQIAQRLAGLTATR